MLDDDSIICSEIFGNLLDGLYFGVGVDGVDELGRLSIRSLISIDSDFSQRTAR